MSFVSYKEIIRDMLGNTRLFTNQIIYCTDTKESFFDLSDEQRIILNEIIYLSTEADKDLLQYTSMTKVYYVKETGNVYKHDGLIWLTIQDQQDFLTTAFSSDEFLQSTYSTKGLYAAMEQSIAPTTLSSVVIMEDGSTLAESLEAIDKIAVTASKSIYVHATRDKQMIIKIPYPIANYDLAQDKMAVIVRGYNFSGKYEVKGDDLVIKNPNDALNQGEFALFIFFYTRFYDLNANTVLTTKNYADKSITSIKLADDIAIRAESIVQDMYNKFVTEDQITYFTSKADGDNTYTKQETQDLIQSIINASPTDLATLTQLSNMLASNPNMSSTIIQQIASKVDTNMVYTKSEVDAMLSKKPTYYIQTMEPVNALENELWIDSINKVIKLKTTSGWITLGGAYFS